MKSSRTPSITFDEIKAMLKAHVEVLLHHLSYIRDIEANKISDEDLNNYLKELFNFSVTNTDLFRLAGVKGLKRAVDIKLKIFLYFIKITRHPNLEVAITALYLAMESELYYAAFDAKVERSKQRSQLEKFQTALNAHPMLKKLHASLGLLLPPDYPLFSNYARHIVRCDRHTDWKEVAQYIYQWSLAKYELNKFAEKLIHPTTRKLLSGNPLKLKLDPSVTSMTGWQALQESVMADQGLRFYTPEEIESELISLKSLELQLDTQIDRINILNDSLVEGTDIVNWMYDNVVQNVEFYIQIRPALKCSLQFLRSLLMLPTVLRELEKSILSTMKSVAMEFARMNQRVLEIEDQLKRTISPSTDVIYDELDKCKCIMEQLSGKYELEMENEAIAAIVSDFKRQIAVVNQLLKVVKEERKSKNSAFAKDMEVDPPTEVYVMDNHVKDEARELALLEGARKRQMYRDQITQQRLERQEIKQAQKKEIPIILPQAPVMLFENVSVKDRLLRMPSSYFNLLLSILRIKKGIHYQNVCHLITTHLDGTIIEHGGSHNAFRIAKLYVEVTCDTTQVTGGMCDPHGGPHQSGVMGRFNVELVAKTLVAAGYSENVLLAIEVEREKSKLEHPTIK